MTTNPTKYTYEPLTLRAHVATVMVAMATVLAVGTWLSWVSVRTCDDDGYVTTCESVPPAVNMLVSLSLTMSAALFIGAALMWARLNHRVEKPSS